MPSALLSHGIQAVEREANGTRSVPMTMTAMHTPPEVGDLLQPRQRSNGLANMTRSSRFLMWFAVLLLAGSSPAVAGERGWGWFARGGSGDSKWAVADGAQENRPDGRSVRANPLPKWGEVPGMMLETTLRLFFPDRGAPSPGVVQAAPTSSSWRSRTIPARGRN